MLRRSIALCATLLVPLLASGQVAITGGALTGGVAGEGAVWVTQALLGYGGTLEATATEYVAPRGGDANNQPTATQAYGEMIFAAGVVRDLRFHLNADVGGPGASVVATLQKCPGESACADTALTCTVTGGGGTETDCADLDPLNAVHFNAGDRGLIKLVTVSASTSASPSWSTLWTGDVANESMVMASSDANANDLTRCLPMVGNQVAFSACSGTSYQFVTPDNFTVKGAYARALDAITAGCGRTQFMKNEVADANLQIDLTDGTTKQDFSGPMPTLAAFDDFMVEYDPSSGACGSTGDVTPSGPMIAYTLVVENPQQRWMLDTVNGSIGSVATKYAKLSAGTYWNIVESQHQVPSPAFTFGEVVIRTDVAPGAGESWTFDIREDGATIPGSTCALSDTATTVSDCPNIEGKSVTAGGLINLRVVPSTTPAASIPHFSYSAVGGAP